MLSSSEDLVHWEWLRILLFGKKNPVDNIVNKGASGEIIPEMQTPESPFPPLVHMDREGTA